MGPFPHESKPAMINASNPAGTDGFAFIEFAHPDPAQLAQLFASMGFTPIASHRTRSITIWRQGDVHYLANAEPGSYAAKFTAEHGPCVVGMGWRMVNPDHAFWRALALGAKGAAQSHGCLALDVPTIEGIGGSLIYFVPQADDAWMKDFAPLPEADNTAQGVGLHYIDHLTHNVIRGRMDIWAGFYERLFNFKQIRFFNIEGKVTGLISRAMTSPCGKIRIPINESLDDQSQIEEYLRDYNGEGIQHVACGAHDIYNAVEHLRANGLAFMPAPPTTYYDRVDARIPGHNEPLARLKSSGILIDGEGAVQVDGQDGGMTKVLLQIFSGTVLGPVFFEFIQRKGDEGFGEGNFRALFESIEEDQIRRGVVKLPSAA